MLSFHLVTIYVSYYITLLFSTFQIVATMVLSIISAIVLMFIVIVAPLSIALTEDEYLDFGCNHRNVSYELRIIDVQYISSML